MEWYHQTQRNYLSEPVQFSYLSACLVTVQRAITNTPIVPPTNNPIINPNISISP